MTLHRLSCSLSLGLLLVVAACATWSSAPSASSEVVTDSELASQVSLAFHEQDLQDWIHINIVVDQAIVTLGGTLKDQETIDLAVELAAGVSGVKQVESKLEIAKPDAND